MTQYHLKAETGKYEVKMGNVTIKVKRGGVSQEYFIITFNILVTLGFAIISFFPQSINGTTKILLTILYVLSLPFLYRLKKFRQFIINIFININNYEESS